MSIGNLEVGTFFFSFTELECDRTKDRTYCKTAYKSKSRTQNSTKKAEITNSTELEQDTMVIRKYHPDVSKIVRAGEIFKSIRLAYDVLSNDETRAEYDYSLKFQKDYGAPWRRNWNQRCKSEKRRNWTYDHPEFEEAIQRNRWAELRWQMLREKYWQEYTDNKENSNSNVEDGDMYEKEPSDETRGSFSEVLGFAFFTLFFMQTLGSRISLMLCTFSALLDEKLDAGYKIGFVIAWALGGRGGVLLTLCLSFTSWLFGKTSSSLVAVAVVAMWVGTNLSRYAPLPQGALITLLYMSVKLQVDL
ncbi:hypothetical protein Sjap_013001 [Stephania japonica]|uniref:J domain-containing protein n=1 Tax=Stephania japonica TaxID=461633 RepID=A0AAP0NYS7_9MAGN